MIENKTRTENQLKKLLAWMSTRVVKQTGMLICLIFRVYPSQSDFPRIEFSIDIPEPSRLCQFAKSLHSRGQPKRKIVPEILSTGTLRRLIIPGSFVACT